ncbi:MAG: hypothetical protein ACTSRA_16955, partial [Promethearchaeota archaeon]
LGKKKKDELDILDAEISELLGEDNSKEQVIDDLEKVLNEVETSQGFGTSNKDEYEKLISLANEKSYSFDENEISEAISLYERALSIHEGKSIDWYNLSQAYLKRAQKRVGAFSYSFAGNYKDLSDFYAALNAAKNATVIGINDKFYWQNLATMYNIMNKKPMALYCARKALEIHDAEMEKNRTSGIFDGSEFKDDSMAMLKNLVTQWEKEGVEEINPFDDEKVQRYESEQRQAKIKTGIPLDHIELYQEAVERYNAGNSEGSKNYCKKALDLKGDFFEAWILLAMINHQEALAETDKDLQNIGFTETERLLDKAIELRPDSIEPYRIRLSIMEYLDKRDEIIHTLEKIIEIEPDNLDFRKKIAEIYLEKGKNFYIIGDPISADLYLRKSIDNISTDLEAWVWYGKNAVLLKDFDTAKKAFLESLKIMPDSKAAIEGLIEVYYNQALMQKMEGNLESSLEILGEIFKLDKNNSLALELKDEILDDFCELGFDAIEKGELEKANNYFENALVINGDYPYAWLGKAEYFFHKNELDAALEGAIDAINGWNRELEKYNDEFTFEGVASILNHIAEMDAELNEKVIDVSIAFKDLLQSFMKFNWLFSGQKIRFGKIYRMIFYYFLSLARKAIEKHNQNVIEVLRVFNAEKLPEHLSVLGDWDQTFSQDGATSRERIEVLMDLKEFLTHFFNKLILKCRVKDISHLLAFINYLDEELKISIPEIYEICNFIDNGQEIIDIFDLIATEVFVTKLQLQAAEILSVSTKKPIMLIRPHPVHELYSIISTNRKVSIVNYRFEPLKSAILTGKILKVKADNWQWSPDGTRAIVTEIKTEKSGFKALKHHVNKLVSIDFDLDPLFNQNQKNFNIEHDVLEDQFRWLEIGQKIIAAGWKDDLTFHAILGDGTLIRWQITGELVEKMKRFVHVSNDYLCVMSNNQQMMTIINRDQDQAIVIDLLNETRKEVNYKNDLYPTTAKWDNENQTLHVLAKLETSKTQAIFRVSKDGQLDEPIELDYNDISAEFIEVHEENAHFFYIVKKRENFIVLEDTNSLIFEVSVPPEFRDTTARGILYSSWMKKDELLLSFDNGTILYLDFRKSMIKIIDERIEFLKKFPRTTFQNKIKTLESIKNAIK